MKNEVGAVSVFECSAKALVGVNEAFNNVATIALGVEGAEVGEVTDSMKHKKGMFAKVFGKKDKKKK